MEHSRGLIRIELFRIAISVAQCLMFLNEECQVMHGDVKHRCVHYLFDITIGCVSGDIRNVVRMGSGDHALIE